MFQVAKSASDKSEKAWSFPPSQLTTITTSVTRNTAGCKTQSQFTRCVGMFVIFCLGGFFRTATRIALKSSTELWLPLQGDHLIAECVYNSEGRSTITLGGLTTREEMCLVFGLYYPRIDLSLCHSLPSLPTVLHSLGIQELWP